jgi:hypothetical protein
MMIPRIRTVKPQLFSHEGLFEIETKYKLPLRLAYIALFTCCDRKGRFRWQPQRLKLFMLPYDNIDITQVLDILLQYGYVQKYEYQGEVCGCIPTWPRHQRIGNKEAQSELPAPEEVLCSEKLNSNFNNEINIEADNTIDFEANQCADLSHEKVACLRGMEKKGREWKGREGKGIIVAPKARPSIVDPQIENVFEHWKVLMDHPNAKLDEKRKGIIRKALKFGYSVSELCQAIAGCSYTPHNMGDNDRGQRYDGLHVILCDADQIDRFIHNCKCPPRRQTDADRRSQANVQTLQDWMQKTMAEETAHGTA